MIEGPSSTPGRRPITLAAASTVTQRPAARISAATQARAARSSSEKARRVYGAWGRVIRVRVSISAWSRSALGVG